MMGLWNPLSQVWQDFTLLYIWWHLGGNRLRSAETMSDAKKPRTQKKKDSKLETRPAFRKAKSLFRLQKPDPATEEAWKLYITNRLKASRLHEWVIGPDDYDDDDNEENNFDEYEKKEFEMNREFIDKIDGAMSTVEKEMGLQKRLLSTSYSVIKCDASYAEHVDDEVLRYYAGVRANSNFLKPRQKI